MVLILVAELLGGETRVSPGGPIDTATAAAEEIELWASVAVEAAKGLPAEIEAELTGAPVATAPAPV
jgi:hypothetical protein